MSDTGTTRTDHLKTEPTEDQKAAERREFLKRGALAVSAGWLGLGGVRELLASSDARSGGAFHTAGLTLPEHELRAVIEQQRANQERLERAIRQMERHIRKNPDGTFELKAKKADEIGIDEEAFEQLRLSLEQGNEYVKSGKLRAEEVRATTGRPEDDAPGRSGPPGGR